MTIFKGALCGLVAGTVIGLVVGCLIESRYPESNPIIPFPAWFYVVANASLVVPVFTLIGTAVGWWSRLKTCSTPNSVEFWAFGGLCLALACGALSYVTFVIVCMNNSWIYVSKPSEVLLCGMNVTLLLACIFAPAGVLSGLVVSARKSGKPSN